MNCCGHSWICFFGGFPINHCVDIACHHGGLCGAWPRSLAQSRIGNVTDGKDVLVQRILKLHSWFNTDKAVIWVDKGIRRRWDKSLNQVAVWCLSCRQYYKVCLYPRAVAEFNAEGAAIFWNSTLRNAKPRACYQPRATVKPLASRSEVTTYLIPSSVNLSCIS